MQFNFVKPSARLARVLALCLERFHLSLSSDGSGKIVLVVDGQLRGA